MRVVILGCNLLRSNYYIFRADAWSGPAVFISSVIYSWPKLLQLVEIMKQK